MNNKVKLKTTKTAAKVAKVQPKAKGSAAASRRLKSKVPIKHVVGVEVKVKDIISKDIEKLHKNPKMELENFIASLVGKGVGETVKFKPKAKQVKVETSKESTISMMSFVSPEKENLGPTAEDSITVPNQAEKGKVDKEKDDEEEEENSFSVVVEKTTEKKEEQAKKSTKEENEEGEATFQVTVEKTDAEVDKTKVATEKTKTKEKQPKMKIDQAVAKTDQVLRSFAQEKTHGNPSVGELHHLIDDIIKTTKNIEKTRKSRKEKVPASINKTTNNNA